MKVKVINSGTVVAHLTPVNEIKERPVYISKEKAKELNLALFNRSTYIHVVTYSINTGSQMPIRH